MSSNKLMTTRTVVMVMSMMICAVPAGRPPESLLIYRIRSSEGRGLTQAHRYMVEREATDWLQQEAPARTSLLLTKAGLELTRRRRNAQADPGVSEDHADTPAEGMPANDFQAAVEDGPNADGTTTVPEQETKTQRRRKIRRKKIPGVAPRSGMLLRHGNSIVKVRRVKKRKKVPEGERQGTQLRMGTAKGNGVKIRQGSAAVKDKTSRQGESYRQGAARQNAPEEEEYYYYYEYYEDAGDSAVQSENVTSDNTSNTQGQEGDGTDGYEDYYYYDESPDAVSPGDGTEGQEGDGAEGDQDYYYDDTGGEDNADGGDGTGGQEGDGTDGDTEYYYDETDTGGEGNADGGEDTGGQEGDGTDGDAAYDYEETDGETGGTDEEFVTFLSTTTTPAPTTTASSSTTTTTGSTTTLSSAASTSPTSSTTSSTSTSTSTKSPTTTTATTTTTTPPTTTTTTPTTTTTTTTTTATTTTTTPRTSTSTTTTQVPTPIQGSFFRDDGAWVWGSQNRVATPPPTPSTSAPVLEPVTINTGFGIVVLADAQDAGGVGVQSNGFGILLQDQGQNVASSGASNTGFGTVSRSKTGILDSSKLRFGAATNGNSASSADAAAPGNIRSGTASKIFFPLRSGSAIQTQPSQSPGVGEGKRKKRRRKGKRRKKPSSASAAPPASVSSRVAPLP